MRSFEPASVENLFDTVAPSYDRLNDILSFGLHRFWKRKLLTFLNPIPGEHWLDLCCGTGDMTFSLARRVTPGGTALGIDSAIQPLVIAKKRAAAKPFLPISWIKGDALDTGLPSDYYDGAVIAYGLRNLASPSKGLAELYRVIKSGGKAGILDFNKPCYNSLSYRFQKFYLRVLVVPIASKFGLHDHYAYIEESLKRFPAGKDLAKIADQVGFKRISYLTIAFGQMGILLVEK